MSLRSTPTNRSILLFVGVCLIGISIHIHDDLPSSTDRHQLEHHISLDQTHCQACIHFMQGLKAQTQAWNTITPPGYTLVLDEEPFTAPQQYSRISNKSPPTYS